MKFTHIIFDLDDTLLDFQLGERTALTTTMKRFFPEENLYTAKETFHRINKNLWSQLEMGSIQSPEEIHPKRFQELCEKVPCSSPWAEVADHYFDQLSQQAVNLPGVSEMLNRLPKDLSLSILTNGIKSIQDRRFQLSSFQDYFPVRLCSQEVGVSKPHPRIFKTLFKKLGNPPKDKILMVGDSLKSDIAGARNVGIASCWYNPHGLEKIKGMEPTWIIEDWKDFPSQLDY